MSKQVVRLEQTLGRRINHDLISPKGWLLAPSGQMVTGELLEHVREAGLEEDLLRAVSEKAA